jgi:hypothetical protein
MCHMVSVILAFSATIQACVLQFISINIDELLPEMDLLGA